MLNSTILSVTAIGPVLTIEFPRPLLRLPLAVFWKTPTPVICPDTALAEKPLRAGHPDPFDSLPTRAELLAELARRGELHLLSGAAL